MADKRIERKLWLIDYTVMILLGSFMLGCGIFWISFAKLSVQLPFLDFPIFTGEIVLALCLLLLLIKWEIKPPQMNVWYWLLAIYAIWVFVKAVHGYRTFGAYSLRNAALFYYPFFALVGYGCFRRDIFSSPVIQWLFLAGLLVLKVTIGFNGYYQYLYFALGLAIVLRWPLWWQKFLGAIGLLMMFPYKSFFQEGKNIVAGNMLASIFLFFVLYVWVSPRLGKLWRWLFLSCVAAVLIFGFLCFAGKNKVKIVSKPTVIIDLLKEYDNIVQERYPRYEQKAIAVKTYNSDSETAGEILYKLKVIPVKPLPPVQRTILEPQSFSGEIDDDAVNGEFILWERRLDFAVRRVALDAAQNKTRPSLFSPKDVSRAKAVLRDMEDIRFREGKIKNVGQRRTQLTPRKIHAWEQASIVLAKLEKKNDANAIEVDGRTLDTDYGNIMFRLLIWRDMLVELGREKPWFGFSFGKPQRSPSLEILNMAVGEWSRDGWIMPHNSYLHLIYRGGIVGVAIIIFLGWSVFVLARTFLLRRSVPGLILTSVLLYWLTIANFIVFLEFPYQAIFFWTVLGMLFAYKDQLEQKVSA